MVLALLCAAWSSCWWWWGCSSSVCAAGSSSAPAGRSTAACAGTSRRRADTSGKGWVYGVARYNGDRVEWFRVFSYAPRPRRVLERSSIEVAGRRAPEGEEELALLSDAVVLGLRRTAARDSSWP